jgi:hypothetical protein
MDEKAKDYFIRMGDGILSDIHAQWEEEIGAAEAERINNRVAMDILATSAKPFNQVHEELAPHDTTGVEDWIQMALENEKMQYVQLLSCRSGN